MALNFVQIGKHIGEIRKRRGLSQQKLSEIIDKSPTYVSYIESGLKCMSLDTFVSIANALHVSADELLKDNIENTIKVANHEFLEVPKQLSHSLAIWAIYAHAHIAPPVAKFVSLIIEIELLSC